jgi:formate dehydrogenase subunit gamma
MNSTGDDLQALVSAIIEAHSKKLGALMPVLHALQAQLGHIPKEAVPLVASGMGLSRAEVHGVISFYHDFRQQPAGDHTIQICRAEACQSMGGRELERHMRDLMDVDFGETTHDGRFTLETVYCLGHCACSPAIRINETFHARVTPQRFDEILGELDGEME